MKSKAIMLNKYGLTVGAAYTEQCTLLEPNNFIPSWESGGEETKEVSNALRNLRQRYDRIKRLVNDKENDLELLNVSFSTCLFICNRSLFLPLSIRKTYIKPSKSSTLCRRTRVVAKLIRSRPRRTWKCSRSPTFSKP